MKLERVALQGFLSHHDTDWSPNGARLVSLVGSNGAGKSSLLDAVSYALFDDARGHGDDLVQLGATDMSATVEFTFVGARYRITRGRSRRAGGKSYLELHVDAGNGSWRPMTRETIRDTEAAIAELLRLDAETWSTAVMLGQGEADRFAAATAGERKRILGQVLGLEVYARGEARCRDEVRGLEARRAADEDQLQRLRAAIAELEPVGDVRDRALIDATRLDATLDEGASARKAAEAMLEAQTIRQAAAAAQAADVDRVEREIAELADRYRRTRDRQDAARVALSAAEATIASASEVEAAVRDLPAARTELDRLLEAAESNNRIRTQISEQRIRIDELDRPYQRELASWETQHDAALAKVQELEAHGRAGTSVCQACGQRIEQATALEQLAAARAAVKALGEAPRAPMALAREEATLTRLEARRRDLGWDPAALTSASERHALLERVAARGEAIDAARAAVEREHAAVDAAAAELEEIGAAGTAARSRLEALNAAAAEHARLTHDVSAARDELARIVAGIEQAQAARRDAEIRIAGAEAQLEQLARIRDEHDATEDRLAAADAELRLLRRLVVAFGTGGIPARIIEGVLPELAGYANELLGELRPGVALELRAQRAKKDGKGVVEALDLIVRDAAGERPLALFSGGERMSVSLALAVGLSRLVARRAGTAIRTFVVDEPDGLDADARRAFGQALRVLAHQGELERVVLVSHHPDLAEYADEVYQVTKGPGGSRVEAVA